MSQDKLSRFADKFIRHPAVITFGLGCLVFDVVFFWQYLTAGSRFLG